MLLNYEKHFEISRALPEEQDNAKLEITFKGKLGHV
jgi:hypothetical protein